MIRAPAVAGQFYPANASALKDQISKLVRDSPKLDAKGIVMPHAGYVYSGIVAGAVVSSVNITPTVVVLGPNHTGYGRPYSIMVEGTWQTPLGDVSIDTRLSKLILDGSSHLEKDIMAHTDEHSIEVEIPFLQYFRSDLKLVPIVLSHSDLTTYKLMGEELADAIKAYGKDVLVIASSDMTHYEPHQKAVEKDRIAINSILELDEDGLIYNVERYNISMCGQAPVVVMISCSKKLGAQKAKLIKYQTSGDTAGNHSQVVGYAGVVIY
jgi:AmmeMemoRadiSam system protein B